MDAVTQELLKLGLAGVVIVVLGWFAWQLYKENRQIMKDRLTDSQEQTKLVLTALMASTAATNAGTDGFKALKDVVETAINKGGRR